MAHNDVAAQNPAPNPIAVVNTGNLGFSIGLAAGAFGLEAEVHLSHDATTWEKERLRRIGANVSEQPCDVVWTTGGSQLPEDQFTALLQGVPL